MIFSYKVSFCKGKNLWLLPLKYWYFPLFAYLSTESLLNLLENVLKLNNFMFSWEHRIHINDTAMCTKNGQIVRQYIYGKIERNLLFRPPCKLLRWLRFIDDMEMKWVENPDCPNDLTTFANSFNSSITVT